MDKVSLATSTGALWLAIATHLSAGLVALGAGTVALAVAKGGRLHKQSGIVFTLAMITVGFLASVIYVYEGKSIVGGIFVIYLIFTATTTVKQLPGSGRTLDVTLMVLAFVMAALMYSGGVIAWRLPGHMKDGVPAGMTFFLGTISLLAGIGDARMIRKRGLRGAGRIARHLWRMCFGLFIATGSFFLGQMKFVPEPIRFVPLMFALAIAPLVILLYWMWRVRFRRRLTGLIVAS
ncbi:MAG TPA: hypothetical protein VFD22_08510 [Gemmatimonadaceae bacterium]|nr:hypothetical protein [Gemmatimonadaceae bacterium]